MKASSHLYPETHPQRDEEALANITAAEVESVMNRLKKCSKEAAHRSDLEKDAEVTAFQFGQYRAYLHASELLKDLLQRNR
jgi:hypothetical protein